MRRACVCLLFLSSCERREQSQKRWGKGQEECKCYPELWPLAKEKYTYKAKPKANVYRKLLIIYKLFRNVKCGVVGTHCPNPLPRSVCISMHRLKIWQLDLSLEIILVNSLAWLCSNAHDILCKPMNMSYTRKEKKNIYIKCRDTEIWKKGQILNQPVLIQIILLDICLLWEHTYWQKMYNLTCKSLWLKASAKCINVNVLWQIKKDLHFSSWNISRHTFTRNES